MRYLLEDWIEQNRLARMAKKEASSLRNKASVKKRQPKGKNMSIGIRVEYEKMGTDGKPMTEGLIIEVAHIKEICRHGNGTGAVVHLHDGRHHDLPHACYENVCEQHALAKQTP